MCNWQSKKLGNLIKINELSIDNKFPFKDIEYWDTASITENNFDLPKLLPLAEAPSRAKRIVRENDIVFSTVRPNQRHFGFIKSAKHNSVVSTGFAVLTPKIVDPKFLYYYLTQEKIIKFFNTIAETHTSTFPAFNPSEFENLNIEIPDDLRTQQKIAEILYTLDEKIDLNRRMNQTLEQMAQTLFRHYFVEGTAADNLSEGISLLDIANLISGGTPKTSIPEFWDGDIIWASAKDVTPNNGTFILDCERNISQEGLNKSSAKLLPKFSTIITARGTVGKICIASTEMSISQSNYALQAKEPNVDFVLFQVVQSKLEEMQRNSYGTVFDTITTNTLRDIKIQLPPSEVIAKTENKIKPLYLKILSNLEENKILTTLRDSLLPKLMSGEIDVMQNQPAKLYEGVFS